MLMGRSYWLMGVCLLICNEDGEDGDKVDVKR
jgi:hypothetical protein